MAEISPNNNYNNVNVPKIPPKGRNSQIGIFLEIQQYVVYESHT